MMEVLPGAPSDSITAGGRPEIRQVAELLERISEITRKSMLQEGTSSLPQRGILAGGGPPLPDEEPLEKVLGEEILQRSGMDQPE